MSDPKLGRLRALAEMVQARAVAELDANLGAEADLVQKIEGLLAEDCQPHVDGFHCAGRDSVWQEWRDGKIAEINRDRATLRFKRETLAIAVARATARVQALDQLKDLPRR